MIAYYRVSTKKQGRSGLGLEAQQKAVLDYIASDKRRQLIAEYKDIESGRNDKRPELKKAIAHAKEAGATLLIAKLDRLSRNVSFIFALRDSKVDFKALDLPDANTLTVGIFASVAQHEHERISERIREALNAKKARGIKLGNNENLTSWGRKKGIEVNSQNARENENNIRATSLIKRLRKENLSYQEIADTLNKDKFKTSRGKQFKAITVQRLYERSQEK